MKYQYITHDDLLNGKGLRVVLWVSGCNHHCKNCHNPETWDINSGLDFDDIAKQEIFKELEHDYVAGITFSGGDPLHPDNASEVLKLASELKELYPNKNIWLYTGYALEEILERNLDISDIDVLVDGEFIERFKGDNLKWIGSSNQRLIDVPKSLELKQIVLIND